MSGGSNNNGTYSIWWEKYMPGVWWYNGSWNSAGINGCCGMWDAYSFDSKTMEAVVEQARNEGSIIHSGEYEVEVCERPLSGPQGYFFTRATNWNMTEIPKFRIGTYSTTGIGGITTIQLAGWATSAGPSHYWAKLQDGTTGTDLQLNDLCSPGGTSPCPNPIVGYQIRGILKGCVDGTCTSKVPIRPTTSLASSWNATVINGTIIGRTPAFPINNIRFQNPSTCTPNNIFLFIATQLIYADGQTSNYVSRNSVELDWCTGPPPEGTTPGNQDSDMHCQKVSGPSSINCSFFDGTCAWDNTLYYGLLSAVSSYGYSDSICALGVGPFPVTFSLPEGSWFWVIVPIGQYCEGSYGWASNHQERPKAHVGSCNYADLECVHTCDIYHEK